MPKRKFDVDYSSLSDDLRSNSELKAFIEKTLSEHENFVAGAFKNHVSPENLKTAFEEQKAEADRQVALQKTFWNDVQMTASKLVPATNTRILIDASKVTIEDTLEAAQAKMHNYLKAQPSLAAKVEEKSSEELATVVKAVSENAQASQQSSQEKTNNQFTFTNDKEEAKKRF